MRTLSMLALALCSGCVTTNTLRRGELLKLDGYDVEAVTQPIRALETESGKHLEYSRGQVLEVESRRGDVVKGQLQRFTVAPRPGHLLMVLDGREFSLDASAIVSTRISFASPWKTVLLVACILTSAAAITVGAFIGRSALSNLFSFRWNG
jgi:hypothetical protein